MTKHCGSVKETEVIMGSSGFLKKIFHLLRRSNSSWAFKSNSSLLHSLYFPWERWSGKGKCCKMSTLSDSDGSLNIGIVWVETLKPMKTGTGTTEMMEAFIRVDWFKRPTLMMQLDQNLVSPTWLFILGMALSQSKVYLYYHLILIDIYRKWIIWCHMNKWLSAPYPVMKWQ